MIIKVILADPPWKYGTWTAKGTGRTSETHYPSMTMDELIRCRLHWESNIGFNAALFMWTTSPMLTNAIYLMNQWDFEYKTIAFTWVKKTVTGKNHFGLGHYTRPGSEICLLGIRGSMKVKSHSVRQVIEEPTREHSRKPNIYDRIEALFDGPYLELFARQQREGWDSWGNETTKFQS